MSTLVRYTKYKENHLLNVMFVKTNNNLMNNKKPNRQIG